MREMVYVLGRMGSAEKALRLIVEGLRDVVQVRGCGHVLGWGGGKGGVFRHVQPVAMFCLGQMR